MTVRFIRLTGAAELRLRRSAQFVACQANLERPAFTLIRWCRAAGASATGGRPLRRRSTSPTMIDERAHRPPPRRARPFPVSSLSLRSIGRKRSLRASSAATTRDGGAANLVARQMAPQRSAWLPTGNLGRRAFSRLAS